MERLLVSDQKSLPSRISRKKLVNALGGPRALQTNMRHKLVEPKPLEKPIVVDKKDIPVFNAASAFLVCYTSMERTDAEGFLRLHPWLINQDSLDLLAALEKLAPEQDITTRALSNNMGLIAWGSKRLQRALAILGAQKAMRKELRSKREVQGPKLFMPEDLNDLAVQAQPLVLRRNLLKGLKIKPSEEQYTMAIFAPTHGAFLKVLGY